MDREDKFDNDFGDDQLFGSDINGKNDSIGNNSGGWRSNRDDDFDIMDDQYQNKVQHKIQQENKQLEEGEMIIGPQNNPALQKNQVRQPEIQLYDIQSQLSSKTISILNFKKTLQTILQYLSAFQIDELSKFIRIILDLASFEQTSEQKKKKKKSVSQEKNLLDQIDSDVSAKSEQKTQVLPSHGIQAIFQIAWFLTELVDKATHIENAHLIQLLKQILNVQTRFYNLPLKPEDFIQQNTEFVQNSNGQDRYQTIEQNIQNAYISLFQFSDQVSSLAEIWYMYFGTRCINNCFRSEGKYSKITTKVKIHHIRVLNELSHASHKMYMNFGFQKEQVNCVDINKADLLKMQKQQLEDYSNAIFDFSHKSQDKIEQYLSPVIHILVNDENSIQKKSLALKLIDKLISNTKIYAETIPIVSRILEEHRIMDYFLKDQTHSQLLRKLPPIAKFLYELEKINIDVLMKLVKEAIKAHEEFFKVVQSILQYVKLNHLQEVFQFLKKLIANQSQVHSLHLVGMIQSVVNNVHLSSSRKKKKSHTNKQALKNLNNLNDSQCYEPNHHNLGSAQSADHPLVYQLFGFLYKIVQDPKLQNLYITLLCKHISLQICFLLPILEQQLTNKLTKPKNYESFIISILDYCLKIDIDSAFNDTHEKKKVMEQKQEGIKYQFINNLVLNCNLYDSIMVMLCKKRFDKNITQKCLNILVLVTKSYKPLEKSHIELLWKIIGIHSTNQYEKQQFFQFIKDVLKNSINLSEESVKHIYFEIILKLHYEWFTPKIYDCFQMLFMRLNEDGKLLTYDNQNNVNQSQTYYLNKTQLVGIEKFFYIYFWSEQKVSKKVKDFLYKLYSYKSQPEIKQKFSYELIDAVMKYMKRNSESEERVLHAHKDEDYEQHICRAFELFAKFLDGSARQGIDDPNAQDNIISVNIHNVTREALPPVKKTIQVNRNMLLKDFKQLIKKEINPPLTALQLINKGKPLKVQKMSLKQLKIQNKNTILVENLDTPIPKKQTEEKKLKQCKQTLRGIFGEQYQPEILDYVAEKCLGQQLEKICEWIMDQDKMKEFESELRNRKSSKSQQEKVLPPKKVEENQCYILTFGQILSKQIPTLLTLIPNNRQTKASHTQKLWNVIRKIPANIEITRQIQFQIQQESMRFDTVFQQIQIKSLNMDTYVWFLIKKIILRKGDAIKSIVISEKRLQRFIVEYLQNLIQNQVYHGELYKQVLQLHEYIINGLLQTRANNQVESLYCLLRQTIYNDQSSNSFSSKCILGSSNKIVSKLCKLSQCCDFAAFKNRKGAAEKLMNLLLMQTIEKNLSSKLLSYLLFNLTLEQNPSKYLPNILTKERVFDLIQIYEEDFLKFYLCCLVIQSLTLNQGSQEYKYIKSSYYLNYEYLKNYLFQFQESQHSADSNNADTALNKENRHRNRKEWLYFLLIGYIELFDNYGQKSQNQKVPQVVFQNDFLHQIRALGKIYQELQTNQLIGILTLINKLSQKMEKNSITSDFLQQNISQLHNFIDFMTNEFIFKSRGVPILTEQTIKSLYYQILLRFSNISNQLLLRVCDKVLKFGVEKRNRDNDAIDFRKNEFVGIQNLGCTCYINSLIQQLYHTRLPYKLLALSRQPGLFELNHAFMQLYMSTKNAINIRPMIQQVKFYGQQIIPTIQQDVEEFLMSLLDYIQSCNGKSIIDSIFGGSYSEELTYFSEKQQRKVFKKHKQEHFYNITLDIKGRRSLNEALVYFFRSQTLDDKVYCEELDQKTPVVKRSFIKHFPKILIFTLKRFEFDMQNMVRIKLNDYLQFPMELDLTEFSLDKFLEGQESSSSELQIEMNSVEESHFYTLCGILIHSGSAETGHYYSYIQSEKKWYEFNDRIVTEINLVDKIKGECFGGGDSKSRNAYMLFYEKVQLKKADEIKKEQNHQIDQGLNDNVQKMEIESPESGAMDEELDKTVPIQQQQSRHHGIFLSQIPQSNYIKQIVREQNNNFIKERLLYDVEYRKFVEDLIPVIIQAKKNNKYETQEQRRQEYLLSERLVGIQKINEVLNPKVQKPIVYFVSNEMEEELKDFTLDDELNAKGLKRQRDVDIVDEIFNEQKNKFDDFI